MEKVLILSLFILSLISLSTAIPPQTIANAAEILSNAGYLSMALTFELVSNQIHINQFSTVTLFAPPDSAFVNSGQPSRSLLRFHFSPLAFSFEGLNSLPFGFKIPTLSLNHSLYVTSSGSNHEMKLNNVTVSGSPIFDDGSLIIFEIDDFFDLNYQISSSPIWNSSPNFGCVISNDVGGTVNAAAKYSFKGACGKLRSRGYSVMSSFLDLQLLLESVNQTKMTVFAPIDQVMNTYVGNYSDYASVFLRHVVPCKITWTDLVNLDDGTELMTYSDNFTITVSGDSDMLMLNGVVVNFPNMYSNDWLVVHGVRDILPVAEVPDYDEVPQPSDDAEDDNENDDDGDDDTIPDHGEF